MPTLRERLQSDLTRALKSSDDVKIRTLRLVAASLTNEEIARKRVALTDDDVLRILEREAKRRREAADAYRSGGREDRAAAELAEAESIAAYLPVPLSDSELEHIVREVLAGTPTGSGGSDAAAVGKVMGAVMSNVRGRADGARVRAVVSRMLGSS